MNRLAPLALALAPAATSAQESAALLDVSVKQLGPSQGTFYELIDLEGGGPPHALGYEILGDLTQDSVLLYQNAGDGSFSVLWEAELPGSIAWVFSDPLATGDLDADGREDFAVVVEGEVNFFRSNGLAPPEALGSLSLPASWGEERDLELRDHDGDGRADLLVLTEERLALYTTNASLDPQSFAFVDAPLPAGESFARAQTTDIDDDGRFDAVLASDLQLWFVALDGYGVSFSSASPHGLPANLADWIHVAVGDVDGDADEDLVLFDADGVYRVARKLAPSSYALEGLATGGPATLLVDVDADGDLDGVCGQCSKILGGAGPVAGVSWFRIAYNDGTGSFAPALYLEGEGALALAGAEDLDGDGDVDLLAGRAAYYSRGGITRVPTQGLELEGALSFGARGLADFDGDGDRDLDFQWDGWRANLGDGEYEQRAWALPALPAGESFGPPQLLGDWDGDGDEDLLVGRFSAGLQEPELTLIWNRGGEVLELGGAVFAPQAVLPEFDADFNFWLAYDFFAADVNGDGADDLAVGGPGNSAWVNTQDQSLLWLNDGAGVFGAQGTWSDVNYRFQGFADLDADGQLDAVLSKKENVQFNGTFVYPLRWRRGFGNGFFSEGVDLPGFPQHWDGLFDWTARDVSFPDLDADGDLDVLSIWSTGVSWARNEGGGQFTGFADQYASQIDPSSVITDSHALSADLNGDGWPELVVHPAGIAPNTSLVFTANGPGAWASKGVELVLRASAADDVDEDGDLDLLGEAVYFGTRVLPHAEGARRQYGAPTPGANGARSVLGASGPFAVGDAPQLRATGTHGSTAAVLAVGSAPAELAGFPFPAATTLVDPASGAFALLPLVSGGPFQPGAGELVLPFDVVPGLAGQTLYSQLFSFEPGLLPPLAASNGLRLRFDP